MYTSSTVLRFVYGHPFLVYQIFVLKVVKNALFSLLIDFKSQCNNRTLSFSLARGNIVYSQGRSENLVQAGRLKFRPPTIYKLNHRKKLFFVLLKLYKTT